MATPIINHDIRSVGGATLYMPAYYNGEVGWQNLSLPNIYNTDDASRKYPRGCKFVEGNRVFQYGTYNGVVTSTGTSVTATNGDDLGGKFLFSYATQDDMANGLLVRKLTNELQIAYQTTISKTPAARVEDYYSGGWVCGKDTTPSDERPFWRRIVRHEYDATGLKAQPFWNTNSKVNSYVDLSSYSQVSILHLDQPVINSKTSMATTICTHPYKEICWQNDTGYATYRQCVGACMHNDPTATYSTWFQTYGEMFSQHVHAESPGDGANERQVILMADGSVQVRTSTYDYLDSHFQIIGYMMYDTTFASSAAAEGLPMLFVTLSR